MKCKTRLCAWNNFYGFVVVPFFCLFPGYATLSHADQPVSQAGACGPLVVDSGVNNAGNSINGFLNDQYRWFDSACQLRSVALARNDTSKGGNAKQ